MLQTEIKEVAKVESSFLFMLFGALGVTSVVELNSSWLNKISKYGIYSGRTVSDILKQLSNSDKINQIQRTKKKDCADCFRLRKTFQADVQRKMKENFLQNHLLFIKRRYIKR